MLGTMATCKATKKPTRAAMGSSQKTNAGIETKKMPMLR